MLEFKKYLSNEKSIILFIYLFLFLTPWNPIKSQVAVFSILLFIVALSKYRGELLNKLKLLYTFKPLLLLVLFVTYLLISTLWSESISEGFKRVFNFHKYEFLFVPVLLLLNKEQAKLAIKIMLASFTLYAFFSLLIYFNIVHIDGSTSENPKGILRYSISTQYMVIAAFSLFFYFLSTSKKKLKVLLLSISIVLVFALFVNYSRTSQLAFLFIALIFIVMFLKKRQSIKMYAISFFAIMIFLISFWQDTKMMNKFHSAVTEVQEVYNSEIYSGSFGIRLYFNKVGLEIIKNNLLFGMGPVDNRSELLKMEKQDPKYKESIYYKHFHSEHMEILTAYGFVGYLLLVSAVVLLIYKLRENTLYFNIGLSVYLTLFFVSFANKTLTLKPLNYIYIILFVLLSIIAYQSEQERQENEGFE